MANLKEIVATLAILSAGTLTLTGCKKEGETTNPDEVKAGDSAAPDGGEGEVAPADGDDAEASCSGEDAPADGGDAEASCSGDDADAEASCSGAA